MSRWVRVDRRYNQPFRLTGYTYRVVFKWVGLVLLLCVVNVGLSEAHVGLLDLFTTAGLIWYAAYCIRRSRTPRLAAAAPQPASLPRSQWQFNAPPNWPQPPLGWQPSPGWSPPTDWPPAPPDWQLWVPAAPGAIGERNSRVIPQDVKIQVSVRDQGRCVQCASAEDLHYDHKIPWSRGGANSVNNIQLLCGPCNRRKGADDIPVWS